MLFHPIMWEATCSLDYSFQEEEPEGQGILSMRMWNLSFSGKKPTDVGLGHKCVILWDLNGFQRSQIRPLQPHVYLSAMRPGSEAPKKPKWWGPPSSLGNPLFRGIPQAWDCFRRLTLFTLISHWFLWERRIKGRTNQPVFVAVVPRNLAISSHAPKPIYQ